MYGLRIENLQGNSAALPGGGWVELGRELTIGRGKDNILVLDDSVGTISKHHCTISTVDDACVLTDHSRNGSFLNGGTHAVERDRKIPLNSGDTIQIGHYILTMVGASAGVGEGDAQADTLPLNERSLLGIIRRPSSIARHIGDADYPLPLDLGRPIDTVILEDSGLTPEDSLMLPVKARRSSGFRTADPGQSGVTGMAYIQPRLSTERIPDDWDILSDLGSEPTPITDGPVFAEGTAIEIRIPPAGSSAAPDNASDVAILKFLEGCGLQRGDFEGQDLPAVMLRVGQALKVTVANFQEELAWQNGVDLPRPSDAAETNPLKFGRDLNDVMLTLLAPDKPGMLVAHEAIDQAFGEMRQQAARAAGSSMRKALGVLEQLAPEAIESRVADTLGSRILPAIRMAKHWKRYCDIYPDIIASVERGAERSGAAERPDEAGTAGAQTVKPALTDGTKSHA